MNNPKPDPGKMNCVSCRVWNVDGCQECRCCTGCRCVCKLCKNCNEKHHPKYFCKVCGKCKRFNSITNQPECKCRKAPNFIAPENVEDGGTIANPLKRKIGLEIECSYIPKPGRLDVPRFIKSEWVRDGSITEGGLELIVYPLFGDDYLRGIAHISTELARFGYGVDQSCGLHCHIDASDFDTYTLRRLILLYHRFEDLFYGLVADGRDQERNVHGELKYYAKRWDPPQSWFDGLASLSEANTIRLEIMKWLYPNRQIVLGGNPKTWLRFSDIRGHKYEKARYYGLNLHTWFQRQTVEYRHHEGTIEPKALLMWPLWCAWFTELASSLKDDEVKELKLVPDLLEGTWERLYKKVKLPTYVGSWVMETLKERGRI